HEGAGEAAALSAAEAAAAERDVLADGRFDDHLAGLFGGDQVDDGALSAEDAARGESDGGGDAGAAHAFDAVVAGLQLIGGEQPTGGLRPVLGAHGARLRRRGGGGGGGRRGGCGAAPAASRGGGRGRGGRAGHADGAEGVD